MSDIKTICSGKWAGILTALGVPTAALSGKHQPCLICGGKDRARWDKQKETMFCGQCQHRSALDFAIAYTGLGFKELAIKIRSEIEPGVVAIKKDIIDFNKIKRELATVIKQLRPIEGTIAEVYLNSRSIFDISNIALYYLDNVAFYNNEASINCCAMVGVIGNLEALHVTYLDKTTGCKLGRKIKYKNIENISGKYIRLMPDNGLIAAGEGIETCLAFTKMTGIPSRSYISAGGLAAAKFSPGERVILLAENDNSFTGKAACYKLANSIYQKNQVCIAYIENGKIKYDIGGNDDFNDLLIKRHGVV